MGYSTSAAWGEKFDRIVKRLDKYNADPRMPGGVQILVNCEAGHRDYIHGPAIKFAVCDGDKCVGLYPSISQALGKVDRIKEDRRNGNATP